MDDYADKLTKIKSTISFLKSDLIDLNKVNPFLISYCKMRNV